MPDAPRDSPAICTTRNIAAGEEITFSYGPHFERQTAHERHVALDFTCECPSCFPPGTPSQRASDLRRRLFRGLRYLTSGEDPVPNDPTSQGDAAFANTTSATTPPGQIIADSDLRKAAEEFRMQLSAIFVYNLLAMRLMEVEGILDDFEVGRLLPGIQAMGRMFRRPENARIAKRAMALDTPAERLGMAFALYGPVDEADDEMASILCAMQGVSLPV